jgi:hypothetical protein
MDAISAIETMTKPIHAAVTRNIVMAPPCQCQYVVNVNVVTALTVPPFVRGIISVLQTLATRTKRRQTK